MQSRPHCFSVYPFISFSKMSFPTSEIACSSRFFGSVIPDAFFCNCDVAAISLVKRFQNDGLKVPEDIAVAGFDNYIMGGHDEFLTTYAISSELMAKRAIHIMLNKISDSSYLTGKFVLGGQIIVRRSA